MTSANVVGYQNKEDTRDNFNYVTPTFRPVEGLVGKDGNEMSLNEIQLDETATTGNNLQILDDNGGMAVIYTWIPVSNKGSTNKKFKELTWPEKDVKGIWAVTSGSGINMKYVDPAGTDAQPKTIKVGQGIQLFLSKGQVVSFCGQVGEETVETLTTPARDNFNYFGNPFPSDISINNIQLDETATTGNNLQILDDNGGMAAIYTWIPVSNKGSTNKKFKELTWPEDIGNIKGIWAVTSGSGINMKYVDPAGTEEQPKTIKAGQCIQIFASVGQTFTVICPYDL